MNVLSKALIALTVIVTASLADGQERFAICHDGNYNDKDDIGAVAMVEAMVWKAGEQINLVHLSHSSHRGANDLQQHLDMQISANRASRLYGILPNTIWDDWKDTRASVLHLASEIDNSSPTNRLTILQGGPWETMALAFDNSDPTNHQYVDIISHSYWNDNYRYNLSHRNKDTFYFQYWVGGPFYGFTPPTYKKIQDQNSTAFKSNINNWNWLSFRLQTRFVLWRTSESDYAEGDMSDAGMLFYYLTGNEYAIMQDIRDFFEL